MDGTAAKKLLIDFMKNKLYHYSGLRQADNMSAKQMVEWSDIMEDAYITRSWVNLERLQLILKNGMSGHWGDFPNLNKKVLNGWLNFYYKEHQSDIDKEVRESAMAASTHKENEIQFWYEKGIQTFVNHYNTALSRFKMDPDTEISHMSIPENIDLGEIWWKVFEEAGLVTFDKGDHSMLVKQAKFRMEREANSNNGEFGVKISDASVESHVKNVLLRKLLSSFIMQEQPIEVVMKEFKLLEIRKRNFFSVLV